MRSFCMRSMLRKRSGRRDRRSGRIVLRFRFLYWTFVGRCDKGAIIALRHQRPFLLFFMRTLGDIFKGIYLGNEKLFEEIHFRFLRQRSLDGYPIYPIQKKHSFFGVGRGFIQQECTYRVGWMNDLDLTLCSPSRKRRQQQDFSDSRGGGTQYSLVE